MINNWLFCGGPKLLFVYDQNKLQNRDWTGATKWELMWKKETTTEYDK